MPSPAELLKAAWTELVGSRAVVLAYLAARALVVAAYCAALLALRPAEGASAPPWLPAATLTLELAAHAALAVLAAAAFTAIAREVGKPLWKVSGPGEGVRRFFMLWYLLYLVTIALARVSALGAGTAAEPVAMTVMLVGLPLFAALSAPVGAAIMFFGRFEWHELAEATTPLVRQASSSLLFVLIGMLAHFVLLTLALGTPTEDLPTQVGLDLVGAGVECLLFVGGWLICQFDRDNPETDYDF